MIEFPSPPNPRYPGGCTLEPAAFALDWLVNWRADVLVNGQTHRNVVVLDTLRAALHDPAAHGVTAEQAVAARDRFLTLGGQLLEAEGGERGWLEREFRP